MLPSKTCSDFPAENIIAPPLLVHRIPTPLASALLHFHPCSARVFHTCLFKVAREGLLRPGVKKVGHIQDGLVPRRPLDEDSAISMLSRIDSTALSSTGSLMNPNGAGVDRFVRRLFCYWRERVAH